MEKNREIDVVVYAHGGFGLHKKKTAGILIDPEMGVTLIGRKTTKDIMTRADNITVEKYGNRITVNITEREPEPGSYGYTKKHD